MNFKTIWHVCSKTSSGPEGNNLALLLLRLWLAQEFLFAGYTKLSGGLQPPPWFTELQFPAPLGLLGPQLNWLMAGSAEMACALALIFGVGTRAVVAMLLYITYVAIYSVHFDLGWSGWNMIETEAGNGFKVPLMMALMQLVLLVQGAGEWSVDARLNARVRPRDMVAA